MIAARYRWRVASGSRSLCTRWSMPGSCLPGGAFAIALVLVLWRVHAHRAERAAIAKLYRALAAWVRSDADEQARVLLAVEAALEAIDAAEGRLAVSSPAGEAFRVLVDEADRILLDLVALRNTRKAVEIWDRGRGPRVRAWPHHRRRHADGSCGSA